jgi:lipopolysaccharide biosynthesis regulator YciM
MINTEQFIQLLKNDDAEQLNLIYIKHNWNKEIDFEKVYQEVKDKKNGSVWNIIGYMYSNGIEVEQNYSKALEYYHLSAAQNNSNAQNNIGMMYGNGYGVEQNYSKALEYYLLSAEQNNAFAQLNLGHMYNHGKGVEKDYSKALEYYILSAELNDPTAQDMLGTFSNEIIALKRDFNSKNRQLEEKIGELEAEIIELKYRPGGIGYQEAKNEFEKLKN